MSVGLLGNAADVLPELLRRGVKPDCLTDQTSAHDPINGYLPKGWTLAEWEAKRTSAPDAVAKAARQSMAGHVRAMLEFHKQGVPTVDYGNNIRQMALEEGVADAFSYPGFVPAYIRPLFCRGVGPFRWAALSGDPEDIYRTDAKVKELMPGNAHLHNWLDMARKRIKFQGLPARICWVGLGDRHRLGLAFNEMVATGELKAPIVIGRDHLDSGSVASPNRETEAMRDGSDAVSDWPLLNGLLNCASGATWVSLHHGGGVGMGFSQHAGMVIVCDGTPEAARRIERVLWNDPASGVMRHADAGYEDAIVAGKLAHRVRAGEGVEAAEHLTCGGQRCEANGPSWANAFGAACSPYRLSRSWPAAAGSVAAMRLPARPALAPIARSRRPGRCLRPIPAGSPSRPSSQRTRLAEPHRRSVRSCPRRADSGRRRKPPTRPPPIATPRNASSATRPTATPRPSSNRHRRRRQPNSPPAATPATPEPAPATPKP